MDEVLIGVDLGTSSCKAVAYDVTGRVMGSARRPYTTTVSTDGAATQRPAEWIAAAFDALAELTAGLPSATVRGIGLSGQIGTHVLLDDDGGPLGDAVTWQDGRSSVKLDELWSRIDRDALAADLDTWLPSGGAFPLPRLLWLRASDPARFERAGTIAQPKDILCQALTGRLVSDPSSWRGIARPDGSLAVDVLAQLGLPEIIPELIPGSSIAGTIRPEAAEATGLSEGTPVFVGWNDLNASLLGLGAVATGDAFDIGGTSEHLGAISSTAVRGNDLMSVPQHGVSTSRHTVYGVTSNAGSVLEWLRTAFRLKSGAGDEIGSLAAQAPAGSDGLLFLPYLHGERAPIWDPAASAGYIGLTANHGTPELVRSALEGVAFNLRHIRETLPDDLRFTSLRATGGTTQLTIWNTIKADVLDCRIVTMEEPDSSSLGAAMVAAIGTGVYSDPQEASAAMVREGRVFEPDPSRVARYADLFDSYLRIYPILSDLAHQLRQKGTND